MSNYLILEDITNGDTLKIESLNKNGHVYNELITSTFVKIKTGYYIDRTDAIKIIKHLKREFDVSYNEIGDLN